MSVMNAGRAPDLSKVTMDYLIQALFKFGASDLHLKVGRPPCYRIHGKLVPARMEPLTAEVVEHLVQSVLTERQMAELRANWQVDASFWLEGTGRFRCNVFRQRNTLSATIRMIPMNIPRLEDLGVPSVLKQLGSRDHGLLLVTGPTGAGKSTTLAALIQYLNETQSIHILTIEDPIEYVFRDQKASITQREVGSDTHDARAALHAGLRQDPDVIVLGEMRDYETIRVALTAAETGHLVISTMHTVDARGSVERILDVIPPEAQNQVRLQLSTALVGVVSQQLLPRSDGKGRVLASEVMVNSPAVAAAISENRLLQLPELMASSNDYYQMKTFNQSLRELIEVKMVTAAEALKISPHPDDLQQLLAGIVRE